MYKRILENTFRRLAQSYPVITLTGPRQSGKTTLCRMVFPEYSYVNLEALDHRQFALEDPRGFLTQNKPPIILDEIQRAPELVSYIQSYVDELPAAGQYILTGSQQFEASHTINQSLAGRTAIVKLLPLALTELYTKNELATLNINEILFKGFYPRLHEQKLEPAEALSFYLATYVERDIRSLMHIKNLGLFEKFLHLVAGNIGQQINYSRLANDCGVDQKTIQSWLSLLEASYLIFRLPPHFTNFRKRVTKAPKLYFCDIGLAVHLLGINNSEQIANHPLRGAIFENFIVTEFLKNRFNHVKINNLYYFRDSLGNELDLILDYGTQLVSVEIKAGQTINSDYFKGLSYYHQLAGSQNNHRYVVYAGEQSQHRELADVCSYRQLDTVFQRLEEM